MSEYQLLSNVSSGNHTFIAGEKTLIVGEATGWGSLAIQVLSSSGNYVTLDNGTKSANFASTFDQVPKGTPMRVTLTGATAAYVTVYTSELVGN